MGFRRRRGSSQAVSSRAGRGAAPRRVIAGFFALFLVVGVVATWFAFVLPVLQVLAARSWAPVQCTVVSSRVQFHEDSDSGGTYSVEVRFRYLVEGQTYTSDRYSFFGGSSSGRKGKQAIVDQLPEGSMAMCYVDPNDPASAVIERGFTLHTLLNAIPVLFVIVGAGGMYATLCRRKSPGATLRGGQGASLSETGEVALTPKKSRMTKLVGLLLVAVFWNGIVSIFVLHVVEEWREGSPSWFMTLFMIPFVLVGVGLVGGVVHAALGLRNPVPRLVLNRRAFRPGEALELRWEVAGRVHKIQRFCIELVGREEATYRRGTDTRTDREVFARIPLVETGAAAEMAAGTVRRVLPSPLMHSFASRNNKIVWFLAVKGEIPRWPDISDEHDVTILPEEVTP